MLARLEICMKIESNINIKIKNLTIYSNAPIFTKSQYYYLLALQNLFDHFQNMNKNNNFCMYLSENTFLISNFQENEKYNPIVFVNKKGEILFDVNISEFSGEIKKFIKYIDFYKDKEIPEEKKIQLAIRDYKNDKLDFHANSKIVMQTIIDKARIKLSELDLED